MHFERLGLASGAVEAEHELAAQALSERVCGDEHFELAAELGVATGAQVGVDPLLQRREPQLLEPCDLRLRERLVGEVSEWWPAPQAERFAQLPRRPLRIGAPRPGDELLEAGKVELGRVEQQDVTGRTGEQPVLADLLAQSGDVGLDALGHRRGGRFAP